MQLAGLIEALSDPAAYPYRVETVEVCHTHISVVFLAGPYVYKVKKPVELGFLDFSTLDKRRHFCEEEVRLNARLAPEVYLGVVPVARRPSGVAVEGAGQLVEWAVKMQRLPDEATLEHQLQCGTVKQELVSGLAHRIAAFHGQAERGERISACGRFDVVAANARQNFTQSNPQVGVALSRQVYDTLQALTEAVLSRHRALIEARAQRGVPRDTHGDLRLDHIYLFPERQPPADVVVIDCIEFNEQFRFADPVADMAFLVMELKSIGRRDLARAFADAYFLAADDEEARTLLPFYTSYRAAVRGKVEGFKMTEPEVPEAQRALALAKSRGTWLLALGELEQPRKRPGLVLIAGLPGTGKSTLAAELARRAEFSVIRSDLVRKELARSAGSVANQSSFEEGIYSPDWTERTYAECLRQVERLLFEGRRVVVDASFREDARRRAFLETAARWCVPATLLVCQADPNTVRQRLANRKGDASDADWTIYLQAAKSWQELGTLPRASARTIRTDDTATPPLDQALSALRDVQLYE